MSEVVLDDAQVHACLQEVGSVAVPQGMYRDLAFANARFELGAAKGALHRTLGHGRAGGGSRVAVASIGREQQAGVTVSAPVGTQPLQGRTRQRYEAVLGTLAAVHVNHHASGVDVGDLQEQSLLQSQTTGVSRTTQISPVV